jgi:hypothetical protein
MEILGASIQNNAGGFLHAGYISAYPHPFSADLLPTRLGQFQVNLADALALKGDTAVASATGSESGIIGLLHADWVTSLASLLLLIAMGAFVWAIKNQRTPRLKLSTLGAMTLLLFLVTCEEPLPTKAPWEGVATQKYKDPALATRTIIYGLISPALANMDRPISSLANLQDEVGIPAKALTPGQEHALKTYGRDGWGREFNLANLDEGYRVTSSGPDGTFDNEDDISVLINEYSNSDWDQARKAFFLTSDDAGRNIIFHRWNGDKFEYYDKEKAQALTGGTLFDVALKDDLSASDPLFDTLVNERFFNGSQKLVLYVPYTN